MRVETNTEKFYDFNRYRLYDWLTIGYLVVWIGLILCFFHRISYAGTIFSLHLLGLAVTIILSGLKPRFQPLKFLQKWYPLLFLPLFFNVLHYLVPGINPHDIDLSLIRIDRWLTGKSLTIWVESFYHPYLINILQVSYSLFYFLPLLVLVPLSRRGESRYFNEFAFAVLATFYLSYLGYVIFPALGPRFYLAHQYQKLLSGSGPFQLLGQMLNNLENIQWDAFPSGHTAVALVVLFYAYKFRMKIFYLLIPLVVLLVISTVFLRYHYLIDVIAGAFLTGFVLILTAKLFSAKSHPHSLK